MSTFVPARQSPALGVLYMSLTAVVLFPSLNASVKFLLPEYSIVQIIWVRSIIHMSWMLALFMPALGWRVFATRRPFLQLSRSALQLTALGMYVTALAYVPLTTATSIAFTAPLMVVALSVPLLGERVGARRWLAVGVGFGGALIIIRPGSGFTEWATLLVLGSAVAYALYQVLTRKVAAHDDVRVTAVYTIILALVISTVAVPFYWTTPVGWLDWVVFIFLGLFGGFGHFFLIKAYEHAQASLVGPFDYGQLVGATVLGYLVFGEFPDFWTWVGAAVLIASGVYVARREARLRQTLREAR